MSSSNFSTAIFRNQLPSDARVIDIVEALKKQFGEKNIDWVQAINGIIRIDFFANSYKIKILQKGLKLGNMTIPVFEWTDAFDHPQVKVSITGLPKGIQDADILEVLRELGACPTSDISYDYFWDEVSKKKTNIRTGKRFVHIKKPDTPLPSTIRMGPHEAFLKHWGQYSESVNGNIFQRKNQLHQKIINNQPPSHPIRDAPSRQIVSDTPHPTKKDKQNEPSADMINSQSQTLFSVEDMDLIPPSIPVPLAPIFGAKAPASKKEIGTKTPTYSKKEIGTKTPSSMKERPARSKSRSRNNAEKRSLSRSRYESPSKVANLNTDSLPSSPVHDYYDGLPSDAVGGED